MTTSKDGDDLPALAAAIESEWGKATSRPDEERFLAGPKRRQEELRRVLRIVSEFVRGFRALHRLPPCVTVFGSARFAEGHPHYDTARRIGEEIARLGSTVMTGGGPGIMEAANRGAQDAGGHSVGCNIELPHEQVPNPYLDRWIEFRYFFVRKVMLVKYSYAFVALPGGFGTMDEIFETVTLMQTKKISDFPMILVGTEFWGPLLGFLRERMVRDRTIEAADVDRLLLTDRIEDVVECLRASGRRRRLG